MVEGEKGINFVGVWFLDKFAFFDDMEVNMQMVHNVVYYDKNFEFKNIMT